MRGRLRQEDGIALVMALSMTVVLSIMVFAMISYTTSGQRSSQLSSSTVMATHYAEAGTNAAYSVLSTQNNINNGNPTAANLLGCSGATGPSDTNGPSNCTSPTPKVYCLTGATCTAGSPGSVSVYGFYSGTNPVTYRGIWLGGIAFAQLEPATTFQNSRGLDPTANSSGFVSDTYTQLVTTANAEPDKAKRKAIYDQLNDLFLDESFLMVLSTTPARALARAGVHDVLNNAHGGFSFTSSWLD